MTWAAILAALLIGYVIGRVHRTGRHADRDFKQWQACLTAEALKPKEKDKP